MSKKLLLLFCLINATLFGQQLDLEKQVKGALPVANGGTSATTAVGALTALGAEAVANKNNANGYAGLDALGRVDITKIPDLSSIYLPLLGNAATASAVPFSGISSGTNTTGAMVIDTGASLSATGTGTIVATSSSGNSATATALASNPDDCSAGEFANTIAANGNLGCSALPAGSTTVVGIAEAAIASEVDGGSDSARYVTPDALAGSTLFGRKVVQVVAFDFTTNTAIGDGKFYFVVPAPLNGMNLVAVNAQVITAGTTNATNVDLARCAAAATGNACSGTVDDMLSVNMTIDSGENSTDTATAPTIDTTKDDVATGQIIRVDVDAVSTTPARGLLVTMQFQLP